VCSAPAQQSTCPFGYICQSSIVTNTLICCSSPSIVQQYTQSTTITQAPCAWAECHASSHLRYSSLRQWWRRGTRRYRQLLLVRQWRVPFWIYVHRSILLCQPRYDVKSSRLVCFSRCLFATGGCRLDQLLCTAVGGHFMVGVQQLHRCGYMWGSQPLPHCRHVPSICVQWLCRQRQPLPDHIRLSASVRTVEQRCPIRQPVSGRPNGRHRRRHNTAVVPVGGADMSAGQCVHADDVGHRCAVLHRHTRVSGQCKPVDGAGVHRPIPMHIRVGGAHTERMRV
jgi:hypothetical protein